MRRRAIFVMAEGEHPHPGRANRRCVRLENPSDDGTIGEHVVIVVVPLAGRARGGRAFEDQRGHHADVPSSFSAASFEISLLNRLSLINFEALRGSSSASKA